MIKRILVALGGTPFSATSIDHAIELAQRHRAELTGVILLETPSPAAGVESTASAGRVARALEERPPVGEIRRQIAERFTDDCRRHGVAHTLRDAGEADPIATLIDLWRYHDLVVFGLRGIYDYHLFPEPEHVVARLVRAGLRPILANATAYRHVRRALVAYDGTASSAKALKLLAQMRPWPDAEVEVAAFGADPQRARALLDDAAAYLGAHGLRVHTHHHPGSIRHDLLTHAHTSGADLIALGDGFDASLAGALLDDTFTHVLRQADLPILCTH